MTGHGPVGRGDDRRVRRAAAQVGLWVGIASAIVLTAGAGILIAVILATGRPELGAPGTDANPDHIVVDVDRVLPVVIVLTVLGVLLLGAIAVIGARRAVRPLAHALRLQRDFVSDASHELRTPLTALSTRIQLLQRRHARAQPFDDVIGRLRQDADAMGDVITDLLVTAEGGDDSGPADVAASVSEALDVLRPLADEASVSLHAEVDERPWAALPPVTLTRILMALVDNAVLHSPEGTAVTVSADADDRWVRLRVADQGAGIAAADLPRIFDRFARGAETGRRRGFGLGLALVQSAAERRGGSVSVEATSAAGTTFLVTLPARQHDSPP